MTITLTASELLAVSHFSSDKIKEHSSTSGEKNAKKNLPTIWDMCLCRARKGDTELLTCIAVPENCFYNNEDGKLVSVSTDWNAYETAFFKYIDGAFSQCGYDVYIRERDYGKNYFVVRIGWND